MAGRSGRGPATGDGHCHPPLPEVALAGIDPLPCHVVYLQTQIRGLRPAGPARNDDQDGPALPCPGHQAPSHGRPGWERWAQHHQVDSFEHGGGGFGPGHAGPGEDRQSIEVDA